MSKHHCFPKSRFPGWRNQKWNIIEVTQQEHNAYNLLFGSNATPYEAIIILFEKWTPERMWEDVLIQVIRYFHYKRRTK